MVPGWTEARVRERDKVEGRGGSQEEGGEREMVDIGGGVCGRSTLRGDLAYFHLPRHRCGVSFLEDP